jgi:uncharacterized protein YbaP (TraB family)
MRKIGIIIAFVGLSFSISAQNQGQYTGALLWKISGKDLKNPSYVLGTHHAVPISFMDSIPGLGQTLKQIKQVVGEIELLNPAKIQSALMQYSRMPAGYSYKTMLSDYEYKLLDKELTNAVGVGLDNLGSLHPTTIYTLLIQVICLKLFPEMQSPNFEPFDTQIQKMAYSQKKKVMGLETVEEQFEILYNSEPIETQLKTVLCIVKDMDKQVDGLMKINEIYYQEQLDKLYEFCNGEADEEDEDCTLSQSYLDALITNRNKKWLTILPKIMKSKSSLIAVGAGHLGGESGVLKGLHKMGYTVEPVIE